MVAALAFVQAEARQIMTLLNGDEIEVEIESIGTENISYKKASNPSGPTYSINKDKVFFITYDDGKKEVITQADSDSYPSGSSLLQVNTPRKTGNTLMGAVASLTLANDSASTKKYFNHISIYPRASIGFHATPSGYKDQYDIDWGGLTWSFDLNVLFPTSNESAWSLGFGICSLSGRMQQLYTTDNGKKKHKVKMGDFTTMYLTIPVGYWYRVSSLFMLGATDRSEILVSQRMNGKKIKDSFCSYRNSFTIDGIFTIGNFDIGANFLFNFLSAFKGDDLDWSPTIGMSLTAGYRF